MPRSHPQVLARSRLPELDAIRGFAVLLMVLYHAAFDLRFFYGWPIDIFTGGWWLLARTSAILFLLTAGICATISWERMPCSLRSPEPFDSSAARPASELSGKGESDGEGQGCWHAHRWRKILRRFAVLASAATTVSFTTWLIAPQDFVKFGILHLFALSTLLFPLFAPLKHWNSLLGIIAILVPTVLTIHIVPTLPTPIAILLGFPPPSFSSLDYFPLFPWFGMILIGTAIGHSFYISNLNWRTKYPIFNSPAFATSLRQGYGRQEATAGKQFFILNFAGRHSLLLYLVHQPILLALLFLLLKPPSSY